MLWHRLVEYSSEESKIIMNEYVDEDVISTNGMTCKRIIRKILKSKHVKSRLLGIHQNELNSLVIVPDPSGKQCIVLSIRCPKHNKMTINIFKRKQRKNH